MTNEEWTQAEDILKAKDLRISYQFISENNPANGCYLIPNEKICEGVKFAHSGPFDSNEAAAQSVLLPPIFPSVGVAR